MITIHKHWVTGFLGALMAVLMLTGGNAWAVNYYWATNAASSDLSAAANWTNNEVPWGGDLFFTTWSGGNVLTNKTGGASSFNNMTFSGEHAFTLYPNGSSYTWPFYGTSLAVTGGTEAITLNSSSLQIWSDSAVAITNNSSGLLTLCMNLSYGSSTGYRDVTYTGSGNIEIASLAFRNNGGSIKDPNLVKSGAGTLTIDSGLDGVAAPTMEGYGGKTTINAGTVKISQENCLGRDGYSCYTGADKLTLNGGTLRTTASFDINDSGRGITLGASGGTFAPDAGTTLTISNVIAGTGGLTKTGSGTLALTATNTYTGATLVSSGVLSLTQAACLSTQTVLQISSGATNNLNFTGTNSVRGLRIDGVVQSPGVYNSNNLPALITGAGNILSLTSLRVTMTNNDASGASSFNTAGTWSDGQVPSAGNAYFLNGFLLRGPATGGTYTFGGDSLTISNADGSGSAILMFKSASTLVVSNLYLINGCVDDGFGPSVALTLGGTMTVSGSTNLISVTLTDTLDVQSTVSGTGALQIGCDTNTVFGRNNTSDVNGRRGAIFFSASNSYSGTITVVGDQSKLSVDTVNGVFQLRNLNAVRNASVVVNVSHTATNLPALTFLAAANSAPFNIGALATGANASLLKLSDTASNPVTVSVGGNNSNTTYAGVLTGSGGLIKTGTGTMTLSGANTYAGGTTVSNGTLLVNGSVTGVVTVAAGTLGGTGTVAGVVTNFATIGAGETNTIGTLSLTNLVMRENSTCAWNYNGTTNDVIRVLGNLTLPTVATVNVSKVVSGTITRPVVLFTFGSCNVANDTILDGWVINGAETKMGARVINNQVVMQLPGGMIIEIY